MFEDLMSAYGSRLVIAVLGVGAALLLLFAALWMIRGRNGPSPFVRGGKNRQPRLQVLDAAAVDTRRRLVLVRRDNVEHLIMIGGPTDIVIESGISVASAAAAESAVTDSFVPLDLTSQPSTAAAVEPRPNPAPRPIPPEPHMERPRENAGPREALRSAPTPTAAASGTTIPPKAEPPAPVAPEVKGQPLRPIAALAAANASAHSLDNAANVLDAARGRVLQEASEPRVIPVTPATVPPALQPAAERPKQLGSDFEQILEQEMANNLAAGDTAVLGRPNRQLAPRGPEATPVPGVAPEPSLQTEVARIFGEMSATRDK